MIKSVYIANKLLLSEKKAVDVVRVMPEGKARELKNAHQNFIPVMARANKLWKEIRRV